MAFSGNLPAKTHAQAIQGDLVARIADFLARKSLEVPGKLETLYRAIESKVQALGLKKTMRSLVGEAQQVDLPASRSIAILDQDWPALMEKIHLHGKADSIENYTEFLFVIGSESTDPTNPWR